MVSAADTYWGPVLAQLEISSWGLPMVSSIKQFTNNFEGCVLAARDRPIPPYRSKKYVKVRIGVMQPMIGGMGRGVRV